MADEFKFPDEIDDDEVENQEELDITAETDGDDVEIVVEDDTPEEDRGVEPLPEEIKQELETVDKSKEYSKNVKDKFTKYKKAWHDERRAKEAAFREQQEALRIAQQVVEENKRLKDMLHNGEKELISNYQVSAELELDKAKTNYREAYDSGDPDKLVIAQEEMFKAQLKLDKAKNFRPTVQNVETEVQIPQQRQQPAQTDEKVAEWVADNKWFVDPQKAPMRKYAEAYHFDLEKTYGAGFVGTDKYYEEIDAEMRRRFPEEFSAEENAGDKKPQRTKPSTVVAPAKRSTASKKVVLNKSQMATIKKLGISPEQYVREQMKLEA
jgi:hypothetical protein